MELDEINNRMNTIKGEIELLELMSEYPSREEESKLRALYEELDNLCDRKILMTVEPTYSTEEIDLYLCSPSSIYQDWLVAIHSQQEKVGHVTLNYRDKNIFYEIDEKHRGHRYATKALTLLRDEMIDKGLAKMHIVIEPDNKPSINTALGFGGQLVRKTEDFNVYEVDLTNVSSKK